MADQGKVLSAVDEYARDFSAEQKATADAAYAALKVDRDALLVDRDALKKAFDAYRASHPDLVPTMRYGVSATAGAFEAGYAAQAKALNVTACYLYGQATVRYSQFDEIPDDHDIWIQTLGATRAEFDAMFASFPRNRKGRVFIHPRQEPEDNIENGTLTLATWQKRADDLYAAADASGLPYLVKSVELMRYTLQLDGSSPARTVSNYLRPGVQHVGWSNYAEKKVVNGHEVAQTDPVKSAAALQAWAKKTGLGWSLITGWSVDTAYLADPVTIANRVAWLKAMDAAYKAAGCQHLLWFDRLWPSGDYRIETDPALLAAWFLLFTH